MRGMIKILSISADGKSGDFRLMKPDAFSGVFLLRMLSGMPKKSGGEAWRVARVRDRAMFGQKKRTPWEGVR